MFKLNSFTLFLLIIFSNVAFSADREDTVCGWFMERLLFKIWSSAAPDPDESRVSENSLIKSVEFETNDGKVLKGYKYQSHDESDATTNPKGYVLMALGNAMIADQMISKLKSFAQKGYDAYIFDYRGYGRSQGKRRINAFIEDYKELVNYLNMQYERHMLYGVSLGGAVIANVIGRGVSYDRAVIDSSPSRFSSYGCPVSIDPSENIPNDAKDILVITGTIDPVLKPKTTSEYRELAEANGATVFIGPNYSHPFMDNDLEVRNERLEQVINFLDGSEGNYNYGKN